MKREGLYLDTSVVSAYYDKRAKERQKETIKFWDEILPGYQTYISEITGKEIKNTREAALRRKFIKLIEKFKVLKLNAKIRILARSYIEEGVFAEKHIYDSLHVAIASFHKIPYLASWNFEHLVKVKTRRLVTSVNILKGFKEIEIVLPTEL